MVAVEALEVGVMTHGLRPGQGVGVSGDVTGPLRSVEVLKYQDGAMNVAAVMPGSVMERTSSSW